MTTTGPVPSGSGARSGAATKATKSQSRRSGPSLTKLSVSLPAALVAEVRRLPGGDNVSAIVTLALERWAADVRLGRMLAELDAIHGPVPAEVQAEVDQAWRNL